MGGQGEATTARPDGAGPASGETGRSADRVGELAEEFLDRHRRGEHPAVEEYAAAHPELAGAIRRLFPALLMVEDLRPSASDLKDSHPTACGTAPGCSDPAVIDRYAVIERLGEGGFGRVYLARDSELDRRVAVKVPRPDRISRPEDVETYLAEARILARLDHPHIVPVYDVGRTDDGLCFVVSKYLEGSNLADRIAQGRPAFRDAAQLVAGIAEALHYAHTHGLVHRDIKPANILIDAAGKPCVADFGLALKDEDFGKGGGLAGTPAYMSPEQARGEGHRVDGRSDIFSLGVVLYELLTGQKPFQGDSLREILGAITTTEPRPPRQIEAMIPRELERISLKALAKRAAERYTTAEDMADDLRYFLDHAATPTVSPNPSVPELLSPGTTKESTSQQTTPSTWDPEQRSIKVVPKGLRSFDEHDADFFLELLPGPRDRDGLPESIRFWKSRIESTDSEKALRVGLIYGPSGCGKSSLVKAGLLPQLASHVLPVYIEATPEETESRLLKGLRKNCPNLPPQIGLVDSLAEIRTGRAIRSGQKVLLVLDQFEQWLHANRGARNSELVAALRQCDGERAQAVVMVRDDFWMAATSFFDDLEAELVLRQTAVAVDLFDPRHARRVLRALGTAYGDLPEKASEISKDQNAFLDQAISGLTQDGKIISVRLALFAEMVKGKPWTAATLSEAGGTEGLGLTFLEETFSASTAPAEHRLHQKAAQGVLKALLPSSGSDIKGQMRSEAELRAASSYTDRPRDFDDLLRILDPELRLITPTDPEGVAGDGWRVTGENPEDRAVLHGAGKTPGHFTATHPATRHSLPTTRYYQLTHDYLVHSLRDWLTRKQRETRRGRAELRLAERAALWNAKPENRRLPSAPEWVNIRLLTRKRDWTDPQRTMMKRAGRWHGLRALGLGLVLSGVVAGGLALRHRVNEDRRATTAAGLVQRVLDADTPQVPDIVAAMRDYRQWVDPALRAELGQADDDSRRKLHAGLALLPVDRSVSPFLEKRLLTAAPGELTILRDALRPDRGELTPRLWSAVESLRAGDAALLPPAAALALYDPDSPRWGHAASKVAQALVSVNPVFLGTWLDTLRPVRAKLTAPLSDIFRDKSRPETEHALATNILADYAADDPGSLAELLMAAEPKAYATLFPVAEKRAEPVLPVFQAELSQTATYSWNDPPLDPSWARPDAALESRIEAGQGMIAERFAFCQTMPLDDFLATAEGLRRSGYHPTRVRPYADGDAARVAAVWTRDSRDWRVASGLSAQAAKQRDEAHRKESYLPADVAGYLAKGSDGKPVSRYAALWVQKAGDDDARLYVATPEDDLNDVQKLLDDAKLIPRTLHALRENDGKLTYSGVWGKPSAAGATAQGIRDLFEGNYADSRAVRGDEAVIDVALSQVGAARSARERARAALDQAEKSLKAWPGDDAARRARALASLRLGEPAKSLEDWNELVAKDKDDTDALAHRAIALSRLGKKDEARTDLAALEKVGAPGDVQRFAALVVAAELGEGFEKLAAEIDQALKKHPDDWELRYAAARGFALASPALGRKDKIKWQEMAARALGFLKEAVQRGDADFGRMDDDFALDPIRDDPGFVALMKAGHPDRRYAAVWSTQATAECISLDALSPAQALARARALAGQGYRPVAWTGTRSSPDGEPLTASVWHRPAVTDETRDRLAERQARAAVALVRLGQAETVWPLLRHSADPRLRSFIVNWLNPLGADAKPVADELTRLDSPPRPAERGEGGRRPGEGSAGSESPSPMDALLFNPDTSTRRALVLALGTYGNTGLSPGEREPLITRLLDLYRNDPDAGIHGAAEWTLRKWGQAEKLKAIDLGLPSLKDRGNRRWFVNGQGQTLALIEGPLAFRMGSPPTETERLGSNERPRRMVIPRRFAIATKEVSVAQFQRFLKGDKIAIERYQLSPSVLQKFSPDPDGPWIGPNWYTAAHYCNWLSEQEGLPADQWCYIPASGGAYAEGMTVPADVLARTGYRLPTEAEWEYACRAGTTTARYHGTSIDLLGAYAHYQANSAEHTWPSASMLPNDLGLFDMMGNAYEWTHDMESGQRPVRKGTYYDHIKISSSIMEKHPRLLRGGSFYFLPALVRSAYRFWSAPAYRLSSYGFRPSRTYN